MRPLWYGLPRCASLGSWDDSRQIPVSMARCVLLCHICPGSWTGWGGIQMNIAWCILLRNTSPWSLDDQVALVSRSEQRRTKTFIDTFKFQQAFLYEQNISKGSFLPYCFVEICYWRLAIYADVSKFYRCLWKPYFSSYIAYLRRIHWRLSTILETIVF